MKNLSLNAKNLEAKGGILKTLSALVGATFVVALNLGIAPRASAVITVVSYWRLGESDPGASAGSVATIGIDSVASHNLKVRGPAFYSSDVSIAALAHLGSSQSVSFGSGAFATNTIVSTATDNFGIEAWVKPA